MEFGLINAYMSAGIINKIVFLLLAGLSIYSWSIIIEKIIEIKKYIKTSRLLANIVVSKSSQKDNAYLLLKNNQDDYSKIIQYLYNAYSSKSNKNSYKDINKQGVIMLYSSSLFNKSGILATISSTAPFIGLFGTVIGVINSFEQIGLRESVSLATIAPGIAEALYATGLGLFVAIPAAAAYNLVNLQLEKYENEIGRICLIFNKM